MDNPKRALERVHADLAKLPTYLTNYGSFDSLLRRVADCDLNELRNYFGSRAKMVADEIERRRG